jgi:hypothetical protein
MSENALKKLKREVNEIKFGRKVEVLKESK